MSSKDDKKKGKKDKEKDKQKERMQEQQAKRERQRQQAQQRSKKIDVLERSGILDAYEYFLRAICKNGLPQANIFEFAAQQILKYHKKVKQKQSKRDQLSKSPERQGIIEKSPDKSRVAPPSGKEELKKK